MNARPHLLFDFDSTLVEVEALDELFSRTLDGGGVGDGRVGLEARFREITDAGMAGEIPFETSLRERVALLAATRADVAEAARALLTRITPSVARNRGYLSRHRDRIRIVSGGFEELIGPVAHALGLLEGPDRIVANRFAWNDAGRIAGTDATTSLARGGKAGAVRALGLEGEVWAVGDGATDLALREAGIATRFIAFVENRRRAPVVERADAVVGDLDELIRLIDG